MADADVKTDNRSRFQRLNPWWIAAGVCVVVLVLWMLLPWEWSTIDDAGFATNVPDKFAEHGIMGGIASQTSGMFQSDIGWGLFRPSYWVFPAFFYWLPIGVAHSIRLLMVFAAIAGPLVYLRRRGATRPTLIAAAVLLISGCSALYVGLTFLSLQELSGAAFVGLGLAFRRSLPRLLIWTIAAWFKAPFAWLLIGYAIPLWRRGERRMALLSFSVGLGTLAIAAYMARNGEYTNRFYRSTAGLINDALLGNGPRLFELPTILIITSFAWWWIVSRSPLRKDAEALGFAVALIGYSLNLLPWSTSGYYMGPVLFLLALFLSSLLGEPRAMPSWRLIIALLIPIIVAIKLVSGAISQGVEANTAITGTRDCLLRLGEAPQALMSGSTYYVATLEGADRLGQIMNLRVPGWGGSVQYIEPGQPIPKPAPDYYVWIGSPAVAPDAPSKVICQSGPATVYRLG